MKKFYKYAFLLLAAFLFAPLASRAQQSNADIIKVDKQVTQTPDDKGQYWITLETFVTGTSVQTQTPVPSDIVLVLDVSGSMAYESSTRVTTLEEGKMYAFTRNRYDTRYGKVFKNGNTYYLRYSESVSSLPKAWNEGTGWASGSTIPSVPSNWTAYKSRITLMQEAVKSFVRTVKQKGDENNVVHNIAIVKFANNQIAEDSYRNGTREVYPTDNATQGSTDIIALTSETQCDAAIDALYAGGGTYSDYGLAAAKNIFTNSGVDGHPKVTVFFTDGQPGRTAWDNEVARNAVNYANDIKNLKVKFNNVEKEGYSTVYSIGLLTSETASNTYDVRRFMHYVSSNYNFRITQTNYSFNSNYNYGGVSAGGGNEVNHDYYKLTSDGSALSDIFTSIAVEAGQPAFELGESSVVTLDVISNHFTLPEGSNYDAVKVYTADVKTISNDTPPTYTFYEESDGTPHYTLWADAGNSTDAGEYHNPARPGDETKKILIDRTNQTIRVQNFDYAENCVRKESNGTVHGQKLVMKIPIIVNAANPGGANVQTNTSESGIYVDGTKIDGVEFPMPEVVLPNIIIRKYGLQRYGECASFLVQRTDENGTPLSGDDKLEYNLIVTYERGKTFPEPEANWGEWVYAQIKLQKDGYYKVTETTWAWNYTPLTTTKYLNGPSVYPADNTAAAGNEVTGSNYMVRHVGADTEQEDDATGLKGAIFDFRNTPKSNPAESLSNFNESSKVNIFNTKEIDPALLQGNN